MDGEGRENCLRALIHSTQYGKWTVDDAVTHKLFIKLLDRTKTLYCTFIYDSMCSLPHVGGVASTTCCPCAHEGAWKLGSRHSADMS